jgi:Fur family peroxide stress response transcriptional regulator
MNTHSGTREDKLYVLKELCKKSRLPLTVQRRAIMEALAGREDHPSADQLYEAVRERLPGLSKTTVYRVLETFVRLGVVRRVSHPGAAARYDAVVENHHHMLCVDCQKLIDLEAGEFENMRLPDELKGGFRVLDYSIYFLGVCASCFRQSTHDSKESQSKEEVRP